MIPESLIRYFADSEVTVLGWKADSQDLVLSIRKEIGPESGTITFAGVTYMALSTALTAESISVVHPEVARRLLPIPEMAGDGVLFMMLDSEGVQNVILAGSVSYQRDA